jgi:hypothetical protein
MTIFELSKEYKRQRESSDPEYSFARCHNFGDWCDEQRRLACQVQATTILQDLTPVSKSQTS